MAKRYILTTEIGRVKAKHPPFELQLPDLEESIVAPAYKQKVALVPPFQLMPDETVVLLNTQPVAGARAVLGDDYEHFLAAGGSAQILIDILQEHQRVSLGESSPSASS